ncbi:helix-turn-helix transcriptional regulator [bacterium]|nr:helix-turn-helix transcriptional regulator [bacterium]
MQENKEKCNYLIGIMGKVFKEARVNNTELSCNRAEEEFDISRGNLNRIENGKVDPSFTTMWKAAEASGQKLSKIISVIEESVGPDFTITE